ncbi:hypothetical protein HPP92_008131 [Vanilla planifolia]|uniref:Cytochrome b5 heme-binding domain-containing protein n=1 Tax=Vanilla planifolia TaxID=51239 RepID=A0A835RBQ2_VANPL|nr:hypothetical protein HPP92_008131 [Vanilla planifolia]
MGGEVDKGKIYALSDVSKHSSREDCWLVINGKVYDVTRFMEDHPGGDEVLLAVTGKDASNDFEDVGHSSTAKAMMEEYYVGEIDASTIPAKVKYTPPKQPHYNQDKTTDFVIKILQFLVPLAILGLAVVLNEGVFREVAVSSCRVVGDLEFLPFIAHGSPLLGRHPAGWVQRGQGDLIVYIAMGRMESFWGDDAQVFRPERLIDEEGMYCHESPFKFTAFQHQPSS